MDILEFIVTTVVGLWLSSQEWRVRNMQVRINDTLSKEATEHLIDLKTEYIRKHQDDVKEDIARIEKKIDRLVDMHINRKN